jgi:hypothetical protein
MLPIDATGTAHRSKKIDRVLSLIAAVLLGAIILVARY